MKVGLMVAIEMDSIFAYYSDLEKLEAPQGYELYRTKKDNCDIYVLHSGMGEIYAAAGVQFLLTQCNVDIIVNFGVVGGLTESMKKQKVCVIDRVVHYKYDCSEFMDLAIGQVADHDSIFLPTTPDLVEHALKKSPDIVTATCCSGDKFVDKESEKNKLHEDFEGDVCDMESAGIVLICENNNTPCLLLKAVSDGLAGGAKEFYEELFDASFKCLKITDDIISTL